MKQSELIKEVSKQSGVDLKTSLLVYNTIVKVIKRKLLFGINISLYDFLNFTIVVKKARTINNPRTNGTIEIPKRYGVKVDLPKKLKDDIAAKPIYNGS